MAAQPGPAASGGNGAGGSGTDGGSTYQPCPTNGDPCRFLPFGDSITLGTYMPHIILLHIGTNDADASSGQSDMSNRLAALLDKIIAAAPDTLLVVAKNHTACE